MYIYLNSLLLTEKNNINSIFPPDQLHFLGKKYYTAMNLCKITFPITYLSLQRALLFNFTHSIPKKQALLG